MTLEQLRIFVAVGERQHVTKAAADLNLTQSATSSAIATLEARYATRLFDRVGRRIALTDAGRVFLVEARSVLARAEAAELVLADFAGLKRGTLRLAASQTVGNYWLPRFIHAFRSQHRGVTISLALGNTDTVAAMIQDGSADVGFVEGVVERDDISVTSVADDEMILIVPAAHPWAQPKSDKRINLRESSWVIREEGSGTRTILEQLFRSHGIDLSEVDISLVLPSNEAVRGAVDAGAGASILSKLIVEDCIKFGSLRAVDFPVPVRRFSMLRNKERHKTVAERAFVQLIEPSVHRIPDRVLI